MVARMVWQEWCCAMLRNVRDCGMSLTIEVPDDVLSALPFPSGEKEGRIRTEMACLMYRNGWLSLGKAAELARLDSFLMGCELAAREIPMHYDEEMLQEDLAYACGK